MLLAQQIEAATGQPVTVLTCSVKLSPTTLLGSLLPVGEAGRFEFQPSPLVQAAQTGGIIVLDEFDCLSGDMLLPLVGLASIFPAATFIAVAQRWTGPHTKYASRNTLDAVVTRFLVVVNQ